MNIDVLKIFKDLIETQSYTKTAKLNYITQSAVSQHIKKLELIFKTKLFIKKEGVLELTDIGKIVYKASCDILEIYKKMMSEINSNFDYEAREEIKISSVYSVGVYELNDYIKEFISYNPHIKIDVHYNEWKNVIEDIIELRADIGFIASKCLKETNIVSVPVWSEELVLVCPPNTNVFKGDGIDYSSISSLKLVFFEKDTPSRKYIEGYLKKKGVRINVTMELNNVNTIKAAVSSGAGFSILPYHTVADDEKNNRVKLYRFENPFYRTVYMIYNKRKKFPKCVYRFIDHILRKRKEVLKI